LDSNVVTKKKKNWIQMFESKFIANE